MKDIAGIEVKPGNFVLVKIGSEWVPGIVHAVEAGGLLVSGMPNPTQKGQPVHMTPEKLFILFEINLADSLPGQNHPIIRRVPHPEKEYIAVKGN